MMKFPFFKSLLLSSALVIAWNCSGDDILTPPSGSEASAPVSCWVLTTDQNYLITPSESGIFPVTTFEGAEVGKYDPQTGILSDLEGNALIEGLDLTNLPVVIHNPDGSVLDANGNPILPSMPIFPWMPASSDAVASSATIPAVSSSSIAAPVNSSVTPDPKSSSSQVNSSSSAKSSSSVKSSSSEKLDLGNLKLEGSLNQTVQKNSAISKVTISGISRYGAKTESC